VLPKPVYYPPFNITRASHVVLQVRDLGASLAFYRDVIGLVISDQSADTAYLRGIEEACHHSLVLKQSSGDLQCERIGMRVLTDDELDKVKFFFDKAELPAKFVEIPYQDRTLHVQDSAGVLLELCATMKTERRLYTDFELFKGGAAQRFDHYQILVPDVTSSTEFYSRIGFRVSEYMTAQDRPIATFMFRKGDTQDIVFFEGDGPRLHHFAYTVAEAHDVLRACDIAGNLGFGDKVERGPQRHGPAGVLFVYFRDPDGHRVELSQHTIRPSTLRWSRYVGTWGNPA
jgi:catechol 2,3-dioxygenase